MFHVHNAACQVRVYFKTALLGPVVSIEILDIECVLLSFLSKNFVSTKWRIYKGILASPRLLRREFRAVARSAIVFFCQAKFAER